MDQHAIPRQITTFEFKLIGFLTLKQFLYLLASVSVAIVLFFIFPIPIINIILAGGVVFLGVVLAFIPIYQRPADQLVKDFIHILQSPTQFVYKKNNKPLYFLDKLFFVDSPHVLVSHIESLEKLNAYKKTKAVPIKKNQKTNIHRLLSQPAETQNNNTKTQSNAETQNNIETQNVVPLPRKPFLIGVVKNNKKIPLPGILVYIKDDQEVTIRLLKTNPHGSFATFQPLSRGKYSVKIKDPSNNYFFDKMEFVITDSHLKKLELFSKETL